MMYSIAVAKTFFTSLSESSPKRRSILDKMLLSMLLGLLKGISLSLKNWDSERDTK